MKKLLFVVVILSMLLAACAPAATQAPAESKPAEEQKPAEAAKPTEAPKPAEAKPTEAPKAAEPVTIRALFMKQAGYQESDIQAMSDEFMKQNPNIKVELDFVTYEALHDKIVTAAAAKAGTYDIILMDCIWPAEFAAAGFILDVTDKISEDMKKDIWPGALEAVAYKGKLYGMPWLNDIVYFYYNEELLKKAGYDKPPKTYTEMTEMAIAAKKKGVVEYPLVETFHQDEGMTISFSYFLIARGGKMFDADDKPAFNSPEGLETLNWIVKSFKDGLFNPSSAESGYEEVRHTFSQGASLFSANWAYQLNMANDPKESQIAGKAKIAPMPGEKLPSATINGGMGLAITSDSKHPDEAWKYILYVSSKEVQKKYAQNALPIWMSLFDDPDLIKMQPVLVPVSKEAYKYIYNRPLVPFYSEATKVIAREMQAAVLGKKSPEQALKDAETEILKIREQYKPAGT
jgi:multiple sugar transport system substrate-binding protein